MVKKILIFIGAIFLVGARYCHVNQFKTVDNYIVADSAFIAPRADAASWQVCPDTTPFGAVWSGSSFTVAGFSVGVSTP